MVASNLVPDHRDKYQDVLVGRLLDTSTYRSRSQATRVHAHCIVRLFSSAIAATVFLLRTTYLFLSR
jgi:hypothetical protein